jgi:hypothetical protein
LRSEKAEERMSSALVGLDELRWWLRFDRPFRVRDTVSIRVQEWKMGLRTDGSVGSFIARGTLAPARLGLGLEPGIQNYIANEQAQATKVVRAMRNYKSGSRHIPGFFSSGKKWATLDSVALPGKTANAIQN